MPGRRKSPDEQKRLEEILALAAEVDPTSRHARVRFMVSLGEKWVKGKAVPALANFWGMNQITLRHDAQAAGVILRAAGPEGMAEAATHAALERLHDRLGLVAKLTEKLRAAIDKRATKPSELRDLAQALASVEAQIDRGLEWLGKVGKLTSDSPTVQVNIAGQRERMPVEALASMPDQLLELIVDVVREHPEHAAFLPLLEQKITERFAPGGAPLLGEPHG
jgi:hypothetical protein